MSTQRFTALAAKLYPITEQNPIKRPEDIKQMIEVGIESNGTGHALFHSLYKDYTGRLTVGVVVPRAKNRIETVHGIQTIVREDTLVQYGLPVRAFLRAARGALAGHTAQTLRVAALNERVTAITGKPSDMVATKASPVYRDGLLALSQELQRRKDARPVARTSNPDHNASWPHIEI